MVEGRDEEGTEPWLKAFASLWPGLRYLSYGLIVSWMYLLTDYSVWRLDGNQTNIANSLDGIWYFGTALVVALGAALFPQGAQRLLKSRAAAWAVLPVTALGIFLLLASGRAFSPALSWGAEADALCLAAGQVLCALVTIATMLRCADAYCELAPGDVPYYMALSELVPFFVFSVVTAYGTSAAVVGLPPLSGVLALVFLPALAWACLRMPRNGRATAKAGSPDGPIPAGSAKQGAAHSPSEPLAKNDRSKLSVDPSVKRVFSAWRIFLALALFSATAYIVHNSFASSLDAQTYQSDAALTILARAVIAVALIVFSVVIARRMPLEKIYLFMATALVVVTLVQSFVPLFAETWPILRALSNCLLFMMDYLIWCILAVVVRAKGFPPLTVYGLFRVCASALLLVLCLFGTSDFIRETPFARSILVIVLVAGVLISASFIFNETNLSKLLEASGIRELGIRRIGRALEAAPESAPSKKGLWGQACSNVADRALLSEREREILRQLADNRTPGDMADHLHITRNTVRTHTRNIYAKLDVHSRDELIALVREEYNDLAD